MSRYYTICLDLQGKRCLVIGGGSVAERKILTLLEYETTVVVVSPKITPRIARLELDGRLIYKAGVFRPEDVEGFFLIIAATDNDQVNKAITREAQKHNILINVVDDPDLSTFILPASVKRGDLTISISTGGKSPALARNMREKLEAQYGPEYGILVDILGDLRKNILQKEPDSIERKKIFKRLAESDELLKILRENGREAAEERIKKLL